MNMFLLYLFTLEYYENVNFFRSFCYCLMDLISDTNGRHPREDGALGHAVPGACQYLQHSNYQHPQGRRPHRYRSMDVSLYIICFWCFNRVSIFLKIPLLSCLQNLYREFLL